MNRGTKYQIYADLNLAFFVVLVFHDPQKGKKPNNLLHYRNLEQTYRHRKNDTKR